uniref:Acyl-coenzyme A oxidase n=1 Tax=Caenorhabditis elegans TaxID=6239 RepID=UPI00083BA4DA|nr:Chain A, Acyl-coenzyme A oxidase [Caenorhabditis elegans]5K3I_B Chain B, Acyl-coenzyme A oxidase [Caenorhabditis elegans]5K3I_C Chain C, Acyl-coenzyme A oxidase [Caenorhabditis elegans]5K3I_D Chain D, Acyl-coenzyme A oxidase [Caenorhabditis elegans]5K3I_E Chain E, Acyl-coenzyme A oxidase [Caenorhabditis elegans]5K3I_F Chain F, Acyl-coenzyme A oxidase [Caenorhabditis elegans]5K3I_G Chain G, Acyl-coenzyme A oxidase [Caenorhabditis elegans]5K3I_H Chain H, Acyl-coenzyme A oxidase [Caenorhabdi
MVHLNKTIQEGDNPDLTAERLTATFDTHAMAAQIYGGEMRARRRREITAKLAEIPELHDSMPLPYMTREEKIMESARKLTVLTQRMSEIIDPTDAGELYHLNNEVLGIEGNPMALHGVMFIPALNAQASDEQQAKWLIRALRREIIGTYAQTEMGHGTNLQNLETTATYDIGTQEFVLHTPKITALKWWPGNLGKSSNYAVVVAHMYIKGKNFGPHTFMVPLRDEKTHKPLPGITIGDIGPKMAYNIVDNGFLGFNNYRIPRTNLLMRHTKVEADGTYIKPPHAKINYSAMVHVRSYMLTGQAIMLSYALNIATRYSAVRRQGQIDKNEPEVKVLEYQTQQHRLFPFIARAYAFQFAGAETVKLYERVLKEMKSGNVSLMADLHALTSGLKSVVTHQTGEGIEQARMACGGHGYSMASYISEIYGVAIGGCTYAGENMVMLLQLARYLVKSAALVKSGKASQLGPLVAYLGARSEPTSLIDRVPNGGITEYIKTFQHIAKRQTLKAANKFFGLMENGEKREIAWNKSSVELNRASRLHTRLFIVEAFARRVNEIGDITIKEALSDLLHLHVNYELLDVATYALEDGFMSSTQLDYVRDQLYFYLQKIRPNAVSLLDSWEFSDRELRSVLGRRDGHVYENLFKWAKESPLNKTDVLPSVDTYLKPMMEKARQSKLHHHHHHHHHH